MLSPLIGDLAVGARFLRGLPGYLRHPIDAAEARRVLDERLKNRRHDFLALARRIYGQPESPYRHLLANASCEYGDLERLVEADGIEGALTHLYRAGVYVTADEFKGRHPIRRGSTVVQPSPDAFLGAVTGRHVWVATGGSGGPATVVPIDVSFIGECAVDTCLVMDARGGGRWIKANWGVPGGGSLAKVLEFSGFGARPVRWFSQLDPAARGLHPRYRWSVRVMRWASWLAGRPLPLPLHVPVDDPQPIIRWMRTVLEAGEIPHLFTFASSAVRLCQFAFSHGLDIEGARFMLVGEPTTEARMAAIHRVGAQGLPRYATTESGPIAYGCLDPATPDDLHVLDDVHALIQPGETGAAGGVPADTVLLTSLRPTVPFVLLNTSMGDQAQLTERQCGCPLEALGWRHHLSHVRSFDRFTGSGMAVGDADVIRVLEETLPERFGGAPTHYQLWEEEAADGHPRLRLLVHPAVGDLDREALVDVFYEALGRETDTKRVMARAWRSAGLLVIERTPPIVTAGGKLLPIRRDRILTHAARR